MLYLNTLWTAYPVIGLRFVKVVLVSLLSLVPAIQVNSKNDNCVGSVHAKVPVITDQIYHTARKTLIASGWQPLQTFRWQDGAELFGQAESYWKRGYREVQACASSGLSPCSFLFFDAYGNKLRIVTQGEEIPELKTYAKVKAYFFVCETRIH